MAGAYFIARKERAGHRVEWHHPDPALCGSGLISFEEAARGDLAEACARLEALGYKEAF